MTQGALDGVAEGQRQDSGVGLASGTLPNTGFWAEVWTCETCACEAGTAMAPPAEPALVPEVESCARSKARDTNKVAIDRTTRQLADLFISLTNVINQLVRL